MKNTQKISDSELSLFCYQFALVLKSGIPYVEAVHLLSEEVLDERLKPFGKDISSRIQAGSSVYEAFKAQNAFPDYLLEMLHIAEESGRLPETFDGLSNYYEKADQVRSKVKSALTYPLLLIGLMTGVILLLVLKILPIFHDILLSVGGEIPPATRLILNFSEALRAGTMFLILGFVLIAFFMVFFFKSSVFRATRERWVLSFPIVSRLFKLSLTVKFSKAYAMLIRSGMDVYGALEMVVPLMGNHVVTSKIEEATVQVKEGAGLDEALKKMGFFNELFIKMVQVGIKSGALEETLEKSGSVYEKELERALNRVTVSIEPTLVIALSLIVGAIMLLVMLPLINIMSSIG